MTAINNRLIQRTIQLKQIFEDLWQQVPFYSFNSFENTKSGPSVINNKIEAAEDDSDDEEEGGAGTMKGLRSKDTPRLVAGKLR